MARCAKGTFGSVSATEHEVFETFGSEYEIFDTIYYYIIYSKGTFVAYLKLTS